MGLNVFLDLTSKQTRGWGWEESNVCFLLSWGMLRGPSGSFSVGVNTLLGRRSHRYYVVFIGRVHLCMCVCVCLFVLADFHSLMQSPEASNEVQVIHAFLNASISQEFRDYMVSWNLDLWCKMIQFLTLGNSNMPIVLSVLELALATIQQTLTAVDKEEASRKKIQISKLVFEK